MLLLLISFIAGVLTVLAPCILPLLPVIVGHSITDTTPNRRRLFVVVSSLGISVILFTLLLKASSLLIDIPQDFWKWISGGIIFLFGLTMIFPSLWERLSFTNTLSLNSNKALTKGYQRNNVWGDIIIGASLGPIFSACSPTYFVILATILPVSFLLGLVYLFTYVLGLALALIVVALLGEKIVAKVGRVSDPNGWFKKIFGLIFILVAVAIVSGYDKKLQISLLDAGFLDVTKIEQKLLEKNEEKNQDNSPVISSQEDSDEVVAEKTQELTPEESEDEKKNEETFLSVQEKNKKFVLAPDISTPDGFINTNNLPISVSEFKGKKVVLLDIWTYSCINCQRTLPYLNDWYKKYEDDGLVIIGLHTPEFSFEKIQKNVEKAVEDFQIKYPVVLDNDFSTWSAYKNQYWPRKYLIDIDGYIVYNHAGEGLYEETEIAIQKALRERASRLNTEIKMPSDVAKPKDAITVEPGGVKSPEVYFGSARNQLLANGQSGVPGEQVFSLPITTSLNKLYLDGAWNLTPEYAENKGNGSILFNYEAKNLYMAAGSDKEITAEIYRDGVLIKTIKIKEERLYALIEGPDYGKHVVQIKIPTGGLKVFTFTFG
ncbi:redoxin domain-containing protein [Candidatus Nomurabacteria bacterium]|nr:redoxin domain-containing protein [Candidatus Nomurabacteria bacterium]